MMELDWFISDMVSKNST